MVVTADVLICPNCRARVFGHWQACKFCGATLRVDNIDATVDPDDLHALAPPDTSPQAFTQGLGDDAPGGGEGRSGSGPRAPWGRAWSSWAGSEGVGDGGSASVAAPGIIEGTGPSPEHFAEHTEVDTGVPADTGASVPWWTSDTASVPAAEAATGDDAGAVGDSLDAARGHDQSGGSLVPLEGAEPRWAPGPAPTVTPSQGTADPAAPLHDESTAMVWDRDESPAGLEPAAWYPESGSSAVVDDGGPGGLESAAWYPESGSSAVVDDGGPAGLAPAAWYPEPGATPEADLRDAPDDPGTGTSGWDLPDVGFDTNEPVSDHTGSVFTTPIEPTGFGDPERPPPPISTPGPGEEPFDTEAIFRAPEPSAPTGAAFRSDLEQVPPPGEIAVNWEPAAADAWDTPVEPKGKPKRQAVLSRESRLLVFGIIITLLAVYAVATFPGRESSHPDEWATSVQQMADWVSKTRKLSFENPVAVTTMGGSDYEAAVAKAGRPDDDKVLSGLSEQVAMWRALGAVQGNPSARLHGVSAQRPELGAFYDLDRKRLVLRNGADLAQLRQGLAGALSIALDDQRANLSSLRSTGIEENPRFDVVLGMAALLRSDYAKQFEGEDDPADTPDADAPQTETEAAFLDMRPELQTGVGAPFVQFIRDVRGMAAADGLAPSPPVSSQQVMLPMAYLDGRGPLVGPQPTVPDDVEVLDEGTLGAQAWYLLLAAHLDDPSAVNDALDFADRWAGDSYVAYRKPDGQVCVADVLRGSDESQTSRLVIALHEWANAVPGGHIDVSANGNESVSVTACDPGASAEQALTTSLDTAVAAASIRVELGAGYYLEGTKIPNGVNGPVFQPPVAWCMGAQAVALAQPEQFGALASRTEPTYRDLTLAAAGRCNSNMADQLFVDRDD
ncbi:MAG TPA: hypothetical protein VFN21_12020 [Acidimicrobiales bacterium]|nr:hypothetical protein [Acidimicrobiales bacterium]